MLTAVADPGPQTSGGDGTPSARPQASHGQPGRTTRGLRRGQIRLNEVNGAGNLPDGLPGHRQQHPRSPDRYRSPACPVLTIYPSGGSTVSMVAAVNLCLHRRVCRRRPSSLSVREVPLQGGEHQAGSHLLSQRQYGQSGGGSQGSHTSGSGRSGPLRPPATPAGPHRGGDGDHLEPHGQGAVQAERYDEPESFSFGQLGPVGGQRGEPSVSVAHGVDCMPRRMSGGGLTGWSSGPGLRCRRSAAAGKDGLRPAA